MSTVGDNATPTGTPSELARDIERRQARLAATVEELSARVTPKALVQSTQDDARRKAQSALYTEAGDARIERIVAIAAACVALIGLVLMRRGRR